MAYEYNDGTNDFRLQLQQVTIIAGQREVHLTFNKINKQTMEVSMVGILAEGAEFDGLDAGAVDGSKTLGENIGGTAWSYVMNNPDQKDQLLFGRVLTQAERDVTTYPTLTYIP